MRTPQSKLDWRSLSNQHPTQAAKVVGATEMLSEIMETGMDCCPQCAFLRHCTRVGITCCTSLKAFQSSSALVPKRGSQQHTTLFVAGYHWIPRKASKGPTSRGSLRKPNWYIHIYIYSFDFHWDWPRRAISGPYSNSNPFALIFNNLRDLSTRFSYFS